MRTVRISDIAQQPLIFPKTGFTRQLLDKQFRPYRSRLRVTMELPSVGMIKRFVAAGLGVSLISASFARDETRAGEVKLIPLADVELWRELGLIYRRDRTLPPRPPLLSLWSANALQQGLMQVGFTTDESNRTIETYTLLRLGLAQADEQWQSAATRAATCLTATTSSAKPASWKPHARSSSAA